MKFMVTLVATVVQVQLVKPFNAVAHGFHVFGSILRGNHWVRPFHRHEG